ncbi:hypothetical protein [Glutamicibacter uratoxydans]|uniref:hypothetical protein n=1 Tax=Glutamicibacter uratoxydans TaxID=43667 RepID=UPI0011434A54|nr:hypothetical protein [Glutamicibacter uratoxydans]
MPSEACQRAKVLPSKDGFPEESESTSNYIETDFPEEAIAKSDILDLLAAANFNLAITTKVILCRARLSRPAFTHENRVGTKLVVSTPLRIAPRKFRPFVTLPKQDASNCYGE